MTWFKVDDQLHSHPKSRRSGLESIGLWTVAGSYCMAYKTDGFVPEWYVAGWPKGVKLAAALVVAGLWKPGDHDGETGWYFHDWADHQPSAEEIERSREFSRLRQRRRRKRLADAREASQEET